VAGNETTIGKLIVRLLMRDDGFTDGTKKAQQSLKQMQSTMDGAARSLNRGVTRAFQAATAAAAAFGAATAVVGAGFEAQMATVGAISGATRDEFQSLTDQARLLGRTTAFTATEAAQGLEALARAGTSVADSITISADALNLAATSGAGLEESTQQVIATMRQFGLEADQSGRIVDVMSKAMRTSLLDFDSVRDAMRYAGTAGAAFGNSLEETLAVVAKLRDLGLESTIAGTNVRMALVSLSKQTDKQQKALAKYGLTFEDVNPSALSLGEILKTVGEAGVSAADAMTLFSTRSGANMARLSQAIAAGKVDLQEYTEALRDSGGETEQMFGYIANTVTYQTRLGVSALQDFMLALYATFDLGLKDAVASVQPFFNGLSAAVRENEEQIRRAFLPALSRISDAFRTMGTDGGQAFVSFITNMGRAFDLLTRMGPLIQHLAELMLALWAVNRIVTFARFVTGTAVPALMKMGRGMRVATMAAGALGLAIEAVYLGLQLYEAKVTEMERQKSVQEQLGEQREALDLLKEGYEDVRQSYERANASMTDSAGELMSAQTELALVLEEGDDVDPGYLQHLRERVRITQNTHDINVQANAQAQQAWENERRRAGTLQRNIAGLEKRQQLDEQNAAAVRAARAETEQAEQDQARALEAQAQAMARLNAEMAAIDGEEGDGDDRVEDREAAAEAVADIEYQLGLELARITEGETAAYIMEQRRRKEETEQTYNDLIALYEGDAEKVAQLEKGKSDAVIAINDLTSSELAKRDAEDREQRSKDQDKEGDDTETWWDRLIAKVGEYREALSGITGVLRRVGQAMTSAFTGAVSTVSGAVTALTGLTFSLTGLLSGIDGALEDAEGDATLAAEAYVDEMIAGARTYLAVLVEGMPVAIKALIDEVPTLIQEVVNALPGLFQSIAALIPDLLSAVMAALPGILDGLLVAAEVLIQEVMAALPLIMDALATLIPSLGPAIQSLLGMVLDALPSILETVLSGLGPLIGWFMDFVPALIGQVVDAIPSILVGIVKGITGAMTSGGAGAGIAMITMLLESIPAIVEAVIESVPGMVQAIVEALPLIMNGIIAQLPALLWALSSMIPELSLALAMMVPDIIEAIIRGIYNALADGGAQAILDDFIEQIKAAFVELFDEIVQVLRDLWADLLSIGSGGYEGSGTGSAFAASGLDYVPAPMRVTVHPGEAVVPADRNARTASGATGTPPAGAPPAEGGGTTLDLALLLDGRVVDAVQVTALERGQAPRIAQRLRKAQGGIVGFSRGSFNSWSS